MTKDEIFYAGVQAEQDWPNQPATRLPKNEQFKVKIGAIVMITFMFVAIFSVPLAMEVDKTYWGIGTAIVAFVFMTGLFYYIMKKAIEEAELQKVAKERFLAERCAKLNV